MMQASAGPLGPRSWLIRRNCSLSRMGRRRVVLVIASGVIGVAIAAASVGAWLVLPFAGLEIALIAWAFEVVARSAEDFERVGIVDEQLCVERRTGTRLHSWRCNTRWAVVELVERGIGCDLFVRYAGRRRALGVFAADSERRVLALSLGQTMKLERR